VNIGRPAKIAEPGRDVALRAEGLDLTDALGVQRLHYVSVTLNAGEIVGIAGVSGNGQTELLDVLSGLRAPDSGTLQLGERSFVPGRWLDPRTARELAIAHVPEDRHARAMVPGFAAWETAVLGYEGREDFSRGGWLRRGRMRAATAALMERFDVRPRDPDLASGSFSGGNQQKLVMGRELGQRPHVLLVGQPTRGVDIGAIEFIHGQLRAMRDAGCALLVVSSELEEILALADRVLVMNRGRVTGVLPVAECSEQKLGLLMCETGPVPQKAAA